MATTSNRTTIAFAAVALLAAGANPSRAFDKPVADKQVRWEQGYWSAVPQVRDGKVSQCVLVARRTRSGKDGEIVTSLSLNIIRGTGFAFGIGDQAIGSENILDDQAEVILDDGRVFAAVSFDVAAGPFALHPGDAAAVLAALAKTRTLQLRSDGAGLDTGAIKLDLPADALAWLVACGKTFDIAIDRPTDPDAPELPTPQPRSPKIKISQPTPAGPPGMEDKQKIDGWDASELRLRSGEVFACVIRQHYTENSGKDVHRIATFLIASRLRGLSLMLKDSYLNLPQDQPVPATLKIGGKPFEGFTARVLGNDEIGIFPQHGKDFARAFDNATGFDFKSKTVGLKGPVQRGVVAWVRACARRNGIELEAGAH